MPLALLAACGDDAAEDGDGRSASGEVLEGTASDAMLPLDQLRSGGSPGEGPEQAVEAGEAEESVAEEEPAAEPEEEPAGDEG